MKKICIVTVFLFFNISTLFSQSKNLSFEKNIPGTQSPHGWYIHKNGEKNIAQIDNEISVAGNNSLYFENNYEKTGHTITASNQLHLGFARGKNLEVSIYIKAENIYKGHTAYLWLSVDGEEGDDSEVYPVKKSTGTHNWIKQSIEVFISPDANNLYFGLDLTGAGKVWFDDFEIRIDGKKYDPDNVPEPTLSEINWIRENSTPVQSLRVSTADLDLLPLKNTIGEAKVIGLGEATHGTSEFFTMKHRLFSFLVNNMGVSIFALEDGFVHSKKMNDFIIDGKGKPKELMQELFGIWNKQEILDLLLWMKKYNESKPKKKLRFYGVDAQFSHLKFAIDNLKEKPNYFTSAFYEKLKNIEYQFLDLENISQKIYRNIKLSVKDTLLLNNSKVTVNELLEILDSEKMNFHENYGANEYDWYRQNVISVLQVIKQMSSIDLSPSTYRDLCMAQNISWLMKKFDSEKIVFWGHNFHVANYEKSVGGFLKEKLGKDYFSIGFASHTGVYNCNQSEKALYLSEPGSYEYYFHKSGIDNFILDLKKINPLSEKSKWLSDEKYFRSIGAECTSSQFYKTSLSETFDALCFINKTSASQNLLNENTKTDINNLIPNAGFEETNNCYDINIGFNKTVQNWNMALSKPGSVSHFNKCYLKNATQLAKSISLIDPKEGRSYVGMVIYDLRFGPANYLYSRLRKPLISDKKYHLSFYIRLGKNSNVSIDHIDAHFTAVPPPDIINEKMIRNITPGIHIKSDKLLDNFEKWVKISGEYIAKGGEEYLNIGSFTRLKDLHYSKLKKQQNRHRAISAYYYLDDFSLSEINEQANTNEVIIGDTYVFRNVHFDFNQSEIKEEFIEELDKLVDVLKIKIKLNIEIWGHTDNEGTQSHNLKLSKKRAHKVAQYLIMKGISASRVRTRGFGSEKPIATNNTVGGKAKNRRVEYIYR